MKMKKLIMLRHGESLWNKENRFTGWTDVVLSPKGEEEARNAGKILKKNNIKIDIAYTSVLKRANQTLFLTLENNDNLGIPVIRNYRLNERHYGALQGLNKEETANKYGEEQVKLWRRSYEVLPPLLSEDDKRNPKFDELYKGIDNLPLGESLKLCLERVVPYYEAVIKTSFVNNDVILIAAHGNSLRSLAKYIENISDEDILNLEIKTGVLTVYELDDNLNFIRKYELS
jgi:2,3-bisphosphoglycerate-dependent phosphoglycerate mutase